MTVYVALVVSSLDRVATAHQIAPWSEDLTHAVGAAFRGALALEVWHAHRATWALHRDANQIPPAEEWAQFIEYGLQGITIPEEYGGNPVDDISESIIILY